MGQLSARPARRTIDHRRMAAIENRMALPEEPSWDLYRTLLAVLEEGSLSGAARQLGMTQPTVGRQVETLERLLGVPLFTRSQLGLAPTDAARALRPHAEQLRAAAAALSRAVGGSADEVRGAVRITAAEVIGIEVLPPILAALKDTHPGLELELVLSDRVQNLLQREADIAVRMVQPTQDALVVRRVGRIGLGLHARADYLARRGTPATMADLDGHALIGFDTEAPFIRLLQTDLPVHRGMFSLRTDSNLAQLAAIRAGFGIGFCQNALARRGGDVVRVLADHVALHLETCIVMHEDLRDVRRYRVVFDALVEGLSRHVDVT